MFDLLWSFHYSLRDFEFCVRKFGLHLPPRIIALFQRPNIMFYFGIKKCLLFTIKFIPLFSVFLLKHGEKFLKMQSFVKSLAWQSYLTLVSNHTDKAVNDADFQMKRFLFKNRQFLAQQLFSRPLEQYTPMPMLAMSNFHKINNCFRFKHYWPRNNEIQPIFYNLN